MGNRLSKIYTRTGDTGTTGLGDGNRVAKASPRIDAIGDVDELNSVIGVLHAEGLPSAVADVLLLAQHDLFDLGGELSIPGSELVQAATVERLEASIDEFNAELPPLKEFILPGGSRAAALCHLARTTCRRAERSVLHLAAIEPVREVTCIYLNRLSDLLFVMARALARHAGGQEVLWDRSRFVAD